MEWYDLMAEKSKPAKSTLDIERVGPMTAAILGVINANFRRGPVALKRIDEALNALEFCVAAVLGLTNGADREAWLRQFDEHLRRAMAEWDEMSPDVAAEMLARVVG